MPLSEVDLNHVNDRLQTLGSDAVRSAEAEWPTLIERLTTEMKRGTPASDSTVRAMAQRWHELVDMFTGGDASIKSKLAKGYREGQRYSHGQPGPSADLLNYVEKAAGNVDGGRHAMRDDFSPAAVELSAVDLDAVNARLASLGNSTVRSAENEWKVLLNAVSAEMAAGTPPESAAAQELAKRWYELLEMFTGGNVAIKESLTRRYQQGGVRNIEGGVGPTADMITYISNSRRTLNS